ncbi:hypothetical protein DXG01_007535, partial [Tephrocybe rancida]
MDPAGYDPATGFSATCNCGKVFSTPSAFKNHENSCSTRKNTLSEILAGAKRAKLRRKAEEMTTDDVEQAPLESATDVLPVTVPTASRAPDSPPRASKRPHILPGRFRDSVLTDKRLRDTLPQPLVTATPADISAILTEQLTEDERILRVPLDGQDSETAPFTTPENVFGLFRCYETLPTHDPENSTSLESLSNLKKQKEDLRAFPYAPYPNRTAFQFGQWYWNEGSQKSQESFHSLMKIIESKDFNPDDIRGINWTKINNQLGLNDWDDDEWNDADAGWRTSSIAIQIPFHRFTLTKGAREFVVKNFYRRPLVSVIREKLALKKEDMRHFHLEPFDLMWRKGGVKDPVRLYGEIYTSPSFAEAHRALQLSPPEPD